MFHCIYHFSFDCLTFSACVLCAKRLRLPFPLYIPFGVCQRAEFLHRASLKMIPFIFWLRPRNASQIAFGCAFALCSFSFFLSLSLSFGVQIIFYDTIFMKRKS